MRNPFSPSLAGDTFDRYPRPLGHLNWIWRVSLNLLLLILGWGMFALLGQAFIPQDSFDAGILVAGVVGSVVGFGQGLIFWRQLPSVSGLGKWALSGAVSWPISIIAWLFLAISADENVSNTTLFIVSGIIFGLQIGLIQWCMLRNRLKNAWWWVISSIASTAAVWAVVARWGL
jgi:hypothetical protein